MAPTEHKQASGGPARESLRTRPNLAMGEGAVVPRFPILILAIAAGLALMATMACSRLTPTDPSNAASERLVRPVATAVATASILITERPEGLTPPMESIRLSPPSVVLDQGEATRLSAEAFGPDQQPVLDLDFFWTAVDPRAGTIDRAGKFQAGIRPGVYEDSILVTGVQNTPEGIKYATAFSSVTVVGESRSARLASVAIIPDNTTLLKHQIYRLRAVGYDENGLVIPGVNFVWKLNAPSLGQINDIGYLTAEGDEGTYAEAITVTGIWEGVRSSAAANVRLIAAPEADDFMSVHALPQRFYLNPGDRLRLRAVALNGLGELVMGTQLRWDMAKSLAGSVDGFGNFIAGVTPGIYTEAIRIEAVVPGERGFVRAVDFASVVIREEDPSRRLNAVSVAPGRLTLAQGGRATPIVRPADEFGEPVKNITIYWEVVSAQVGEVSVLGVFRAGNNPGIYPEALRVSEEQLLDDERITKSKTVDVVITGTLSRVKVLPELAVVAPGRTVHFSLKGWDGNDIELPGLVVIWSVSDRSLGTIDAFGNFTAGRAPGMYQDAIRAKIIQNAPD